VGVIINGVCVAESRATDVYWSSQLPAVLSKGDGSAYHSYYYNSGAGWKHRVDYYPSGSAGPSTSFTEAFAGTIGTNFLPACNESESFIDGMAIGWMIAAAMVAAVSFKLVRRAMT
jgi:hypothetical protein